MAAKNASYKFETDYLSELERLQPTIELYTICDKYRYEVKPHDLTDDHIESAMNIRTNKNNTIRTLFEYFGIVDDKGAPAVKFNPPFMKIIKYSSDEWKLALKNSHGWPIVAYLRLKEPPYDANIENPWVDKWKEIPLENIIGFPPNDDHPDEGYLIISFDEFPDPLIGDC